MTHNDADMPVQRAETVRQIHTYLVLLFRYRSQSVA